MTRPQTLQIFLPSGDPQGIRVAEITTRIVRVIEVPRSLLAEFLRMPEASQVGVYFLVGPRDDSDDMALYIGQSGAVGPRLSQHNQEKDFWNRALVVVSLTNNLTQTHALFLEWLSIRDAKAAGRYTMENGNGGARPHTPMPLEPDCQKIMTSPVSCWVRAAISYSSYWHKKPRATPMSFLLRDGRRRARYLYVGRFCGL